MRKGIGNNYDARGIYYRRGTGRRFENTQNLHGLEHTGRGSVPWNFSLVHQRSRKWQEAPIRQDPEYLFPTSRASQGIYRDVDCNSAKAWIHLSEVIAGSLIEPAKIAVTFAQVGFKKSEGGWL